MEQEKFEVGQMVFYKSGMVWIEISAIRDGGIWLKNSNGDERWISQESITANPVIPERPKRTVTKEGWVDPSNIIPIEGAYLRQRCGCIKVTYQAEE